jgi:hypothetical protein
MADPALSPATINTCPGANMGILSIGKPSVTDGVAHRSATLCASPDLNDRSALRLLSFAEIFHPGIAHDGDNGRVRSQLFG